MVHEGFTKTELMLLTQFGYDVKDNLQDAYKTYKSPSLIEYKVHISLTQGREYFVRQVGESKMELPAGSFKSMSKEQRFMSVSM